MARFEVAAAARIDRRRGRPGRRRPPARPNPRRRATRPGGAPAAAPRSPRSGAATCRTRCASRSAAGSATPARRPPACSLRPSRRCRSCAGTTRGCAPSAGGRAARRPRTSRLPRTRPAGAPRPPRARAAVHRRPPRRVPRPTSLLPVAPCGRVRHPTQAAWRPRRAPVTVQMRHTARRFTPEAPCLNRSVSKGMAPSAR